MKRKKAIAAGAIVASVAGVAAPGRADAASAFDDAVAAWHMAGFKDSVANRPLTAHGKVELGIELDGAEREASLQRGGNGRAARFDGGYLVADDKAGEELTLSGKEMTLCIRMRDPEGRWNAPLFAADDKESAFGPILGGKGGRLEYLWRTSSLEDRVVPGWAAGRSLSPDFANGILRIGVPAELLNPTAWHDVVVRFRGANLEMFVDGALVDEEWPHGEVRQFRGPFLIGAARENGELKSGFHGLIDHLAIWSRALTDAEIVALSGGAEEVARRDLEILGEEQASMQDWKPRGHTAFAGDCMPFYHDGAFHLFYLFDRRHHGSRWGLGAHQYAHAATKDLIHWEHHPLAVPILKQWECSMGTGDVIYNDNDGRYYAFYTDCGGRAEFKDKPQQGSWIFAARSADGVHFTKDFKPLVPGHDCEVFQDESTGLFHLVRGGGNRLVSKDLATWEDVPGDFVQLRPGTSAECPNYFEWNGWRYFILGRNALWKSRGPLGPWTEIEPTVYDGLMVPKVAEFTGNRRLLAGFLAYPGWGGNVVFRELIQCEDGSLGMRFPPEMVPKSGEPMPLSFEALTKGASGDGRTVRVHAPPDGFEVGMLTKVPRDVRITLKALPAPGTKCFGLCFRGEGDYADGCELRFEPADRRVQYGAPSNGGPAQASTEHWSDGHDFGIRGVEGLDRPFTLEVIAKDRIIDACIDGRRTIVTRRHNVGGDRLFFFASGGDVAFDDVQVRPLLDEPARAGKEPARGRQEPARGRRDRSQ